MAASSVVAAPTAAPVVRAARPEDAEGISEVHRLAFRDLAKDGEEPGEVGLVRALIEQGLDLASFVALEGDRVVAHVAMSR